MNRSAQNMFSHSRKLPYPLYWVCYVPLDMCSESLMRELFTASAETVCRTTQS